MKKTVITLILAAVLTLTACGVPAPVEDSQLPSVTPTQAPTEVAATEPPETENSNLAPDFTVYDPTGKPVKLSQMRGKPVVLNFWASWCGPCKMEMPEFQKLYEEMGDQVQFVMVNLSTAWGDTKADAEDLLKKQGYSFPVYYDTDGVLTQLYGITGIPATVFVDSSGAAVTGWVGAMNEKMLRQGIAEITE